MKRNLSVSHQSSESSNRVNSDSLNKDSLMDYNTESLKSQTKMENDEMATANQIDFHGLV